MTPMKISVIIPTYKPGGYLWECLDSLWSQSFHADEYEVIIVLNGADYPWKEEIEKYLYDNSCKNCRLLYTPESGVSKARNLGLDNATGEYIVFIDDDDLVSPSYLEELYSKASKDTVAISYPYAFNDGDLRTQIPYDITNSYVRYSSSERMKSSKVRRFFSGPCMKMIHRDIIADRRFDKRFANGEDTLFMFLISDRIKWVCFTSGNAIYYRRFRQNSAVTRPKSFVSCFKNSSRLILQYSSIYFRNPFKYSSRRYLICVLGAAHTMLSHIVI